MTTNNKKVKPLTPNMLAVLKKYSTESYELPFGTESNTCFALESRGLLQSESRLVGNIRTREGFITTFKPAYRITFAGIQLLKEYNASST